MKPKSVKMTHCAQDELHEQLALGLLAGNVFDWGAKEVALLMESGPGQFEFRAILQPSLRTSDG